MINYSTKCSDCIGSRWNRRIFTDGYVFPPVQVESDALIFIRFFQSELPMRKTRKLAWHKHLPLPATINFVPPVFMYLIEIAGQRLGGHPNLTPRALTAAISSAWR